MTPPGHKDQKKGAFITGIGFLGPILLYNHNKEPPNQNSFGNHLGPYSSAQKELHTDLGVPAKGCSTLLESTQLSRFYATDSGCVVYVTTPHTPRGPKEANKACDLGGMKSWTARDARFSTSFKLDIDALHKGRPSSRNVSAGAKKAMAASSARYLLPHVKLPKRLRVGRLNISAAPQRSEVDEPLQRTQ